MERCNFLFMSEREDFSQRLKDAMTAAGYEPRPAILEREFNLRYWGKSVSFQAARRWLQGEAIPAQDKLQVLAEWLAVEPQALRFGDDAVRKIKLQQARWDAGLKPEERELLETFLTLPPPDKKVIREVILAFHRAQQSNQAFPH